MIAWSTDQVSIYFPERFSMRRHILIILILLFVLTLSQNAQAQNRDKVVQLSGIIQTTDSSALPGASVYVKGTHRGTIANDAGIYSIAVSPGDTIEFSFIGFKSTTVRIPKEVAVTQLFNSPVLIEDTAFLPTAIVRPLPTPLQFKYMFLYTPIVKTNADIARENLNLRNLLKEMRNMPLDGDAIYNLHSREQFRRDATKGMVPTTGLFNPFAWRDFVRSLKEGGSDN